MSTHRSSRIGHLFSDQQRDAHILDKNRTGQQKEDDSGVSFPEDRSDAYEFMCP